MHLIEHGYVAWAPRGLVGDRNRAGVTSLVWGVGALLLAAVSALPLIAWVAALLGIAFALGTVLLPRATALQKVAGVVGTVAALVSMVLLVA